MDKKNIISNSELKMIIGGAKWGWVPIADAFLDAASGFYDSAKKSKKKPGSSALGGKWTW